MPTADALALLDDTLRRRVRAAGIPGAAWGVVADGRLVHAGGEGVSAVTGPAATPGPRTLARIASMTKSFTAAAVLSLRDEGAFGLDDPVAELLPAAAGLRGPTTDSPPVTVRHLLSMDSGLPTDDPWADRHLDLTDDELDALVAGGVWFAWPTGTATQYSNLGYGLLGRLVSHLTGRSCQQVIDERFLRPLGLVDTVWEPRADQADRMVGHRLVDDEAVVDEPAPLGDGAFAPMGGLWSTVADLARWVAFFLDAFPARDDPDDGPLRRSTRREMQRAWRADALEAMACRHCATLRVWADGYAAGLRVVDDLHLGALVSHSGGLPGFGSNMTWLPERGLGVVSLGNLMYAPMRAANRAALEALHHADHLPAPRPVPVPAPLDAAARALVTLLNDWDDGAADGLFADNVALDDPLPRRRRAAAELVAATGPLEVTEVVAVNAADATVRARGERGTATVLVQLHPLLPPRVQWYEATVDEPIDESAGGSA